MNEHERKRDEFPAGVRRFIAAQVGHRCSNPRCTAPTVGPSLDPAGLIDVGVAAHITAASANGPRFDPTLTSDERKHQRNAIWLCQTCAKLIDSDTTRYTQTLLNSWKTEAITRAGRALSGRDIDPGSTATLARLERHNAAMTTLRIALKMRSLIIHGTYLAGQVRGIRGLDMEQADAVMRAVGIWCDDIVATLADSENAMLSIKILWPESSALGLVELHVTLATWRNWLCENVLIVLGQKTSHGRKPQHPWSWDRVFAGDVQERERMKQQIDRDIEHVESWTRPHFTS